MSRIRFVLTPFLFFIAIDGRREKMNSIDRDFFFFVAESTASQADCLASIPVDIPDFSWASRPICTIERMVATFLYGYAAKFVSSSNESDEMLTSDA